MPLIFPEHINAAWPKKEGTIGVVGVAPWATLDFCRKVYKLTHATKDWHYPRIIVDANSKIPSRGRHLELGERDPSPFIASTINELANMGATVAVVPCNTAHILFNRWSTNIKIPVVNIIDASISQLKSTNSLKTVVLGSQLLINSQLFQNKLKSIGHVTINIEINDQKMINECINYLKQSQYLTANLKKLFHKFINKLKISKIDVIFIACTELSIVSEDMIEEEFFIVDSNTALALEALKAIKSE